LWFRLAENIMNVRTRFAAGMAVLTFTENGREFLSAAITELRTASCFVNAAPLWQDGTLGDNAETGPVLVVGRLLWAIAFAPDLRERSDRYPARR
jgi:hypothetical protein